MKLWIDIVAAAGFNAAEMDPMSVYIVAGNIIRDLRTVKSNRGVPSVCALNSMSEEQKRELRKRVAR
jgi:hypothetical protein